MIRELFEVFRKFDFCLMLIIKLWDVSGLWIEGSCDSSIVVRLWKVG